MATRTANSRAPSRVDDIPVRKIGDEDLRIALRQGLDDFKEMRGDLIFVGLLYPLIGIAAAVMTTSAPLLPFFFPVVAGVGLLGPLAAVGFYELARRREAGQTSNWSHFLDVRKRPAFDDIAIVAGLLFVIFTAWLVAAGALYLLFWGYWAPPKLAGFAWYEPYSIGDFVSRLFTTAEGWALIVVGNLVGLVFAALVLAVSVVSLPMLVDRDVSAARAVSASWRAAKANPGPMARWGVIVAGLLVLGSIPLFIGLAFVLPWLGYSTWHLYTRLVDRQALGGKAA